MIDLEKIRQTAAQTQEALKAHFQALDAGTLAHDEDQIAALQKRARDRQSNLAFWEGIAERKALRVKPTPPFQIALFGKLVAIESPIRGAFTGLKRPSQTECKTPLTSEGTQI